MTERTEHGLDATTAEQHAAAADTPVEPERLWAKPKAGPMDAYHPDAFKPNPEERLDTRCSCERCWPDGMAKGSPEIECCDPACLCVDGYTIQDCAIHGEGTARPAEDLCPHGGNPKTCNMCARRKRFEDAKRAGRLPKNGDNYDLADWHQAGCECRRCVEGRLQGPCPNTHNIETGKCFEPDCQCKTKSSCDCQRQYNTVCDVCQGVDDPDKGNISDIDQETSSNNGRLVKQDWTANQIELRRNVVNWPRRLVEDHAVYLQGRVDRLNHLVNYQLSIQKYWSSQVSREVST